MESLSLRNLYKSGLPKIQLKRMGSKPTVHMLHHEPADVVPLTFQILDKFKELDTSGKVFSFPSRCRTFIEQCNYKCVYGSETDIQSLVKDIMWDVLMIMQEKDVTMLSEWSVTVENVNVGNSNRPDFWIMYLNGLPITVIAVKPQDAILRTIESSTASIENDGEELIAADMTTDGVFAGGEGQV